MQTVFNVEELLRAATAAMSGPEWSFKRMVGDNSDKAHGYKSKMLVDFGKVRAAGMHFQFVIDAFEPVQRMWLSSMDPGGFLVPHCDTDNCERWQLPIIPSGEWVSDEVPEIIPGVAYKFKSWKPHGVLNNGTRTRIHLVIDRAVPNEDFERPENVFDHPLPPEMQRLKDEALRDYNLRNNSYISSQWMF